MRSPYGGLVTLMLFSFGWVKSLKSASSKVMSAVKPAAYTFMRAVFTALMSAS